MQLIRVRVRETSRGFVGVCGNVYTFPAETYEHAIFLIHEFILF